MEKATVSGGIQELLKLSHQYAEETLSLQAAASIIPREISQLGTEVSEVTAEGYPNARFHSGSKFVDEIEQKCICEAKHAFKASYANVQPLSCSMANIAVMTTLLNPGDRILGLDLKEGGHLTHGANVSLSGKLFNATHYHLSEEFMDLENIRKIALATKPHLIIAGASSYPRSIDFQGFRKIADEVGAYLLADISHVSGLVVSGAIPSPIDHAHITTTSTYKQLFGPRGGLILAGSDGQMKTRRSELSLAKLMDRAVFPAFQGTPDFGQIAMKAAALEFAQSNEFSQRMKRVLGLAQILCSSFIEQGLRLVSGGTDTHMVVIDLSEHKQSGREVETALEKIGIISNRNLIPNDKRSAAETSGLRPPWPTSVSG